MEVEPSGVLEHCSLKQRYQNLNFKECVNIQNAKRKLEIMECQTFQTGRDNDSMWYLYGKLEAQYQHSRRCGKKKCISCRALFYLRTAVFVQKEKGQFCSA